MILFNIINIYPITTISWQADPKTAIQFKYVKCTWPPISPQNNVMHVFLYANDSIGFVNILSTQWYLPNFVIFVWIVLFIEPDEIQPYLIHEVISKFPVFMVFSGSIARMEYEKPFPVYNALLIFL